MKKRVKLSCGVDKNYKRPVIACLGKVCPENWLVVSVTSI